MAEKDTDCKGGSQKDRRKQAQKVAIVRKTLKITDLNYAKKNRLNLYSSSRPGEYFESTLLF